MRPLSDRQDLAALSESGDTSAGHCDRNDVEKRQTF